MTDSVNGKWVSTKGSKAFLTLDADGTLQGSDGANGITSTWASDDAGALIESFVSTQRAAPGMEMWVAKARRVEAAGDRLNVFDHAGNHLGELTRATDSDDSAEGR